MSLPRTENYSPHVIYAAVKKENNILQQIQPAQDIDLSFKPESIAADVDKLAGRISQLRDADFDGFIFDNDGQRMLVKFHDENISKKAFKLNPIHIHEAEVQVLRYLRGMLLVANHIQNQDKKSALLEKLDQAYKIYQNKSALKQFNPADLTLELADQLTQGLAQTLKLDYDDAAKQLTMARDLGILLEDHPSICTVSEDESKVTIERSTPYHISQQYYEDAELFGGNLSEKSWFKSAKSLAGLDEDASNTWLDEFFKANFDKIKAKGVTAPPSARWLPIPPNNQIIEIDTALRTEKTEQMQFSHTEFLRTGIAIAYDIRKLPKYDEAGKKSDTFKEQQKIAKKILKEIIKSQLAIRIEEYKKLYGDILPDLQAEDGTFNFYVNYQTLLSPLSRLGEIHFKHVDNNARFVKLVKEVIKELDDDAEFRKELNLQGVNLKIRHTNSAVNRNAYLTNESSADKEIRVEKINEFDELRKAVFKKLNIQDSEGRKIEDYRDAMLKKGYSVRFVDEVIQRERASECLKLLLDDQPPYNKLSRYQRNIMMAALEHLAMGSQSCTIAGCKSARDRTGVFACAVKTMMENPKAMRDWKALDRGIVKSLKQGHAFRSMIFHSAIVKVSLVHKKFMHKLNKTTQKDIKSLLVFSRKLDKPGSSKQAVTTRQDEATGVVHGGGTDNPEPAVVISQHDADHLVAASAKLISDRKIAEGKKSWTTAFTNFPSSLQGNSQSIQSLDGHLARLREQHLSSKSYVMMIGASKVRIYPYQKANVNTGAHDFFAFGIDSVRGALQVLQYREIDQEQRQEILKKIQSILVRFQQNVHAIDMAHLDDLKKLEKAQEEYAKFNGVLSSLLVAANCYPDSKHAMQGITEARDLVWATTRMNESVCTVRNNEEGECVALSFSKHMTFPAADMDDYTTQPWFLALQKKHPWIGKFYAAHPEALAASSTPMQRSLPNPANAWDEATILVGKNANGKAEAKDIITGIRMGITSPYKIKDKQERQRLTNRNHLQMATDQRLMGYAKKHVERWKGLLPGDVITIPILHQTLVDPGSLRHIGKRSGSNPKDMIKRKHKANKKLQRYLKGKKIYYDTSSGAVIINPDKVTDKMVKINFTVKETNNGVNIHEKMTIKTPQDVSDAHDLIMMSLEKIQLLFTQIGLKGRLSDKIADQRDLAIVQNYLVNNSLEHPQQMNLEEKQALTNLCQKLNAGNYKFIDAATQKNLALLMQAAVNLSSFMSRDMSTNFIEFVHDGVVNLNPRTPPADMNDAVYKSCYERIMAELLGVRMGGCKSALDREQEVAELTNAMYRQFHAEGKIIGYHDTPESKQEFLNKYVNTQHKHNMCEMITGTPGSSDGETRGQAYRQETDYEKKASSICTQSRHPASSSHTYDSYMNEKKRSGLHMPKLFSMFKSLTRKTENPVTDDSLHSRHSKQAQ